MALKFPSDKDRGEALEFILDLTDWVVSPAVIQAGGTSAVLDGNSVPTGDTDLTIDSVVVAGNKIFTWLAKDTGTDGDKYTILYTFVDNNSPVRTGIRRVTIKIKEK